MFTDVLDTNALGVPDQHISIAELVDLQNGWCPPMPTMMDFDMATIPCGQTQWEWPDAGMDAAAAAAQDMDSVFYYFDRQQGKV